MMKNHRIIRRENGTFYVKRLNKIGNLVWPEWPNGPLYYRQFIINARALSVRFFISVLNGWSGSSRIYAYFYVRFFSSVFFFNNFVTRYRRARYGEEA